MERRILSPKIHDRTFTVHIPDPLSTTRSSSTPVKISTSPANSVVSPQQQASKDVNSSLDSDQYRTQSASMSQEPRPTRSISMPEIDRHALSRGITINRPATELTRSTGVDDLDNRSKSRFELRAKSKLNS